MRNLTSSLGLRTVRTLINRPQLLMSPKPAIITFTPTHRAGDLRQLAFDALPLVSEGFIKEAERTLYAITPAGKSGGICARRLNQYYSPLEVLSLLIDDIPIEVARECTVKELKDVIDQGGHCFTLPQALRIIAHAQDNPERRKQLLSKGYSTLMPVKGNGGVYMLVVRMLICDIPQLKLSKLGMGRGTNPGSILVSNIRI